MTPDRDALLKKLVELLKQHGVQAFFNLQGHLYARQEGHRLPTGETVTEWVRLYPSTTAVYKFLGH